MEWPTYDVSVKPPAHKLSRRTLLKLAGVTTALATPTAKSLAAIFTTPPQTASVLAARNTHDLSLPDWGPYSKNYFGVSHIPDVTRGLRFDLSLFPTVAGLPARLPSALEFAPTVHPWQAAADLSFYTLRLESIDPKPGGQDQLYTDLCIFQRDEHTRLIRMEFVNRTAKPQQLTLNSLAQLTYPSVHENTAEPIRLAHVDLPSSGVWTHALDYTTLRYAKPRPTDNLVPDGKWRGEERTQNAVGGSVIGQHFGRDTGDTVLYTVQLPHALTNAVLIFRFNAKQGDAIPFHIKSTSPQDIAFHGTGNFSTVAVPLGAIPAGALNLELTATATTPAPFVAINGFAILEASEAAQLHFTSTPWHRDPTIESASNTTLLTYADIDTVYGYTLGAPLSNDRKLTWTQLDDTFGKATEGIAKRRAGDPDSLFVHAASQPFTVAPNTAHIVFGLIAAGTKEQVEQALGTFNPRAASNEALYKAADAKVSTPSTTPAGKPYQLGQQLASAVTLTNVVYPQYTQRQYIRHYTPGREWDSVYTWDDGFTGLGLLELDPARAADILNAYTTAPLSEPTSQSAFIHHGTPLPVQVYLFAELCNRTQSRELLETFYPRLLQFHRFIAGRLGSSTTRKHKDGLICTWDYFYSTGGWDDYPPQKAVHEQKLEASVAPVVSSAHVIRCAKLLRQAAAALGRTQDFAELDADVATLSTSLQKFSWDPHAGYYSYVTHNSDGTPDGILRDATGANFNMGLDGVSPLVAGICTPDQQKLLLERIFSTSHLWTDVGITTVDRSAPYYIANGYWNGSVWLAHQWFLWKTMLDLGHAELAIRIAQTALDAWKRSTDTTYNTYEFFRVSTHEGLGWPQFNSLNSPILPWFASLYTPGTLTCGFEVWQQVRTFSANNQSLRARLLTTNQPVKQFSVLACMAPGPRYQATWNGTAISVATIHEGLLQLQLPYQPTTGDLVISVA